jgi:hypothetical protein
MKSFKSFIGIPEDEEVVFQPKDLRNHLNALYLPPSIPNLKYMSPNLWSMVTQGQNDVRVFTPAGELIHGPLPKVLTGAPPVTTTERPLRNFSPTSSSKPKQSRKPVHSEPEEEVKYFFVNGLNHFYTSETIAVT